MEDKAQEKLGMLKFSKDALLTSLTKLSPELEEKAVQAFKSIQGFMKDRSYSFSDGLACSLLELAIQTPRLKNELFAQVIKQLNRNPTKESMQLGWVLFALLAKEIAPDDEMILYVLHATTEPDITTGYEGYAEYIQHILPATAKRPPREQKAGKITENKKVRGMRMRTRENLF